MPKILHLSLSAAEQAELEGLREKAAALLKLAAGQVAHQVAVHGLLKARDPDTVSVGTCVHTIEADRFTMDYRVVSHKVEKVAAEGSGVIVMYDYRQNAKVLLPDSLRQRIEELVQSAL